MLNLKCPNCGGELQVEPDREFCFCQYCGTKILLSDENKKTININKNVTKNTTITNRKIDEAEIIRAQTEKMAVEHAIKRDKIKRFNIKTPTMGVTSIILWLLTIAIVGSKYDVGDVGAILFLASIITSVVAFLKWVISLPKN